MMIDPLEAERRAAHAALISLLGDAPVAILSLLVFILLIEAFR